MNLIKILSHDRWHLSTKTRLSLYKSLIRSIIDYSLFCWPLLSITNKIKLQAIQNSAIRIIFHKDRFFPLGELCKMSGLETLNERYNAISARYFEKCMTNKNPLISELVEKHKKTPQINSSSQPSAKNVKDTILDFKDPNKKPP